MHPQDRAHHYQKSLGSLAGLLRFMLQDFAAGRANAQRWNGGSAHLYRALLQPLRMLGTILSRGDHRWGASSLWANRAFLILRRKDELLWNLAWRRVDGCNLSTPIQARRAFALDLMLRIGVRSQPCHPLQRRHAPDSHPHLSSAHSH